MLVRKIHDIFVLTRGKKKEFIWCGGRGGGRRSRALLCTRGNKYLFSYLETTLPIRHKGRKKDLREKGDGDQCKTPLIQKEKEKAKCVSYRWGRQLLYVFRESGRERESERTH